MFSQFFGNWSQLACLLHGCCFLQRTHSLECRGASPNSKQLQKLQVANFSANMRMCAELKQKVRLFLLFECASPWNPGRVSKSSVSYANFFQKNLTLQKQILWKSNSNLEGFFMGKSIQGFLFLNFPLKSQWQAFKERQNIQWQRGLCSLFHASCYFWHFSHGLFRS
jgi:hypothetical protein